MGSQIAAVDAYLTNERATGKKAYLQGDYARTAEHQINIVDYFSKVVGEPNASEMKRLCLYFYSAKKTMSLSLI